jgi:hypothetical protein
MIVEKSKHYRPRLPGSLKNLIFKTTQHGYDINKLPKNLVSLELGGENKLFIAPKKLERLTIYGRVQLNENSIPDTVYKLYLLCSGHYNCSKILPQRVRCLRIQNIRAEEVPRSVVHLKITDTLFGNTSRLPDTLEKLKVVNFSGYVYNYHELPNSIRELKIFGNYYVIIPSSVVKLKLLGGYNHYTVLPEYVRELVVGHKFNQPIKIHKYMRILKFGYKFNHNIEIPEGVEILKFGKKFNSKFNIPSTLKYLKLGENFNQYLGSSRLNPKRKSYIPDTINHLVLHKNYKHSIRRPYKKSYTKENFIHYIFN